LNTSDSCDGCVQDECTSGRHPDCCVSFECDEWHGQCKRAFSTTGAYPNRSSCEKVCQVPAVVCTGSSSDLAHADCSAWKDLYDSTNGANWTRCSDARSDPCSCNFYDDYEEGTKCTDGHITYIGFYTNNLRGSIPSSLGKLSKLNNLELVDNKLHGSIPSSLGQLSELTELRLYQNMLTGLVPPPPFASTTQTCHVTFDGCTEPQCNHFKAPPPAGSRCS
jgi:hypothetical protein